MSFLDILLTLLQGAGYTLLITFACAATAMVVGLNIAIVRELTAKTEADAAHLAEVLKRMEISHGVISGQDDAVPRLLDMLNRRSNVRV